MKKIIISIACNKLIVLTFFLVYLFPNKVLATDLSFLNSLKWGYSEAQFKSAININYKQISRKDNGPNGFTIDILVGGLSGFGFGGIFRHNKLAALYIVELIDSYDENAIVGNNYVHNVINQIAYANGSNVDITKKGKYKQYKTIVDNTECVGFIEDIKNVKLLTPNPIMTYIIFEDLNNPDKSSKNTSRNNSKTNKNIKTEKRKVSVNKINKNNEETKSEIKSKSKYNDITKDFNKDLLIIARELEELRK